MAAAGVMVREPKETLEEGRGLKERLEVEAAAAFEGAKLMLVVLAIAGKRDDVTVVVVAAAAAAAGFGAPV